MKFTIEKSGAQYFVRLKGNNNEKVATTELYTSKASAQNAINVIKREAASASTADNT